MIKGFSSSSESPRSRPPFGFEAGGGVIEGLFATGGLAILGRFEIGFVTAGVGATTSLIATVLLSTNRGLSSSSSSSGTISDLLLLLLFCCVEGLPNYYRVLGFFF